jgi:hypothetical protein
VDWVQQSFPPAHHEEATAPATSKTTHFVT